MIEVLKQALEALENSQRFVEASANAKMLHGWGEQLDTAEEAITSLRQAIQEEALRNVQRIGQEIEQEPVAYLCENAVGHKYFRWKKPTSIYKPIPLYTHPPQRKPLTDEQIEAIHQSTWMQSTATLNDFARAIEAAHGIKE